MSSIIEDRACSPQAGLDVCGHGRTPYRSSHSQTNEPSHIEKMAIRVMEVRAREKGRSCRYEILKFFDQIAKTETAFYLQFAKLPDADKGCLQASLSLPDVDWAVSKAITRYWNVRTA